MTPGRVRRAGVSSRRAPAPPCPIIFTVLFFTRTLGRRCASILAFSACLAFAQPAAQTVAAPKAGPVAIMPSSEVKAGMKATAWTVFEGTHPVAVPIEILGVLKNAWGPRQDIIIGKMGGRAERTNVAGGMSGSPVYAGGKLMGAVSLRMSVFSPDAICGITPVEQMIEINDFDPSKPASARTPDQRAGWKPVAMPREFASAAGSLQWIDTPLVLSGFHESTLREFSPVFQQMGVQVAQGGAGSSLRGSALAADWRSALQPGDAVSGVLVSGDLSVSAMGTVTYNDGKRVLAFGHPFLNLGPIDMPMARSEVVLTLASSFAPNKMGNATEIVGRLKQDRHSGISGVLGEPSPMIPVRLKVRSFGEGEQVIKERELKFDVFVQQKWTPFLMMLTLFNGLQGLNEFADDVTYRMSGDVEMDGAPKLSLSTMAAPGEIPVPPPMVLAGWWAEKFNRLFLNSVGSPNLRSVNATVDLLPRRRQASIETAWTADAEVEAGAEIPVRVFLRPYRGERLERVVRLRIPSGFPKGDHRILLSDAETLNRMQSVALATSRFLDLNQTVSLINKERSNNRLYASLVQSTPTVYYEDKTMPGLPGSVANVMANGRAATRPLLATPETARELASVPFDLQITGGYSLRIKVK